MALTLEDLAARVEELAREKACTAQHVAALEQEVVGLRAALTRQSGAVSEVPGVPAASPPPPHDTPATGPRQRRPRPITRLGLIASAAAAGAAAVMPVPAHAASPDGPGVAPALPVGTTAPIISPNGLFVLDVNNVGIILNGPGGRVEVTFGQVIVQGTSLTRVEAPLLKLNNGTHPVGRVGDVVTVPIGGGSGTITTGAPNILA